MAFCRTIAGGVGRAQHSSAMRIRLAMVLCLLVVACANTPPTAPPSTPSRTSPASPSPRPASSTSAPIYSAAPPQAIQTWLADNVRLGFHPLSGAELASVRVTAAEAERLALSEPGPGYGPDGAKVVWTKVGCVFLGYYRAPDMPSYGYVPPEFTAYLVQTIGAPAPGFPGLNVEVVLIDAQTRAMGPWYGFGPTPVLGTTCGVTP
jgi:hypothetical protein